MNNIFFVELPICDVCKKLVECMEWHDDINFDVRIFKVQCHGETEKVILSALTMLTCDVTANKAFERKLLQ